MDTSPTSSSNPLSDYGTDITRSTTPPQSYAPVPTTMGASDATETTPQPSYSASGGDNIAQAKEKITFAEAMRKGVVGTLGAFLYGTGTVTEATVALAGAAIIALSFGTGGALGSVIGLCRGLYNGENVWASVKKDAKNSAMGFGYLANSATVLLCVAPLFICDCVARGGAHLLESAADKEGLAKDLSKPHDYIWQQFDEASQVAPKFISCISDFVVQNRNRF